MESVFVIPDGEGQIAMKVSSLLIYSHFVQGACPREGVHSPSKVWVALPWPEK